MLSTLELLGVSQLGYRAVLQLGDWAISIGVAGHKVECNQAIMRFLEQAIGVRVVRCKAIW